MDIQEIRKIYRQTEQRSLIVILLALPVFGVIYLFYDSGNQLENLPGISDFLVWVMSLTCIAVLIIQYVLFGKKIKLTFEKVELVDKVKIYSQATTQRYLLLLLGSMISSVGLLLSKNPVFTLFFAIVLVFFSLAKPTPDRMARLMKLKKEEKELIRTASRPEQPESDK